MSVCLCVCVSVSVCEEETERERVFFFVFVSLCVYVCVCVCVCVCVYLEDQVDICGESLDSVEAGNEGDGQAAPLVHLSPQEKVPLQVIRTEVVLTGDTHTHTLTGQVLSMTSS